ncbi:Ger(x)C family spore germination C-terminal domain-containing protein [Paenibacillus sacheonensis]|uniref:Ger(x)C family spore germination C-terminal domain-containing protein n=1 Tax=Paenibacillus sacheonensis TaxID=742054 RepID=UPI0031FCE0DC
MSLELDLLLLEEGLKVKNGKFDPSRKVENVIAADLTAKSKNVIATLQKTNCDFFQFGQEAAAYHPELYKKMNWREQYPTIKIEPKVKVTILNTGILE